MSNSRVITAQGNYRFPVPRGRSFTLSATGSFNGSTFTAKFLNSTAGTAQVETATVTAAAGCTANGNCALVFTQSGTPNTIDVTVALTTASNTATLVAAALAAGLNANREFALKWSAAGSVATIVITRRANGDGFYAGNDVACNLAIPAGLGLTAAATSVSTTPGVAPVVTAQPFGTTAIALTAAGEKSGVNFGAHNEIEVAVTVATPTAVVLTVNTVPLDSMARN